MQPSAETERTANPERERRLLETAARLIAHFGYDKTTISDIAREAGVSKGAVYLHWPSKEALFTALLVHEMQVFTLEWLERVNQDPDGGKLHAMYHHSFAVLLTRPLLKALIVQDKHTLGDFMRRQNPELFQRRNLFNQDFIRLMQGVGVIRPDIDPQVAAYLLGTLRAGMLYIEQFVPVDQLPPLEAALAGVADFIQRALAPEDGGDSEAGKRVIRGLLERLQTQWAQGRLA